MTDLNSPLLQYATFNLPRQRVEVKSVWDDESAWTSSTSRATDTTTTYYRAVPWLMRGIEMRANALASVPFQIVRGRTPIDTSDEYKDALGILPDPYRILWLLEAALCFGPAYLWRWSGDEGLSRVGRPGKGRGGRPRERARLRGQGQGGKRARARARAYVCGRGARSRGFSLFEEQDIKVLQNCEAQETVVGARGRGGEPSC